MNQKWLTQLEKIKPVKSYKIGEVVFLIYKAKNLYNPNWNSSLLKQITRQARQSYLRYGRVPLIDSYDKNAEVYLCRAIDTNYEEWISLRFVPGQANSNALEDLGQYVCGKKTLADAIATTLLPGINNFQKELVVMSRLCGISPYSVRATKTGSINSPIRMRYTAKSFALVNKVFFAHVKFAYLIGVFRHELLKKLLRFNNNFSFSLPDAGQVLGCEPYDLCLNRKLSAYRFPGYFLNIFQLVNLLDTLIKRKDLSISSIKIFVKSYRANFKKYLEGKNYLEILRIIQGLNKLLRIKGKIPAAKLSGHQLRQLVAEHVDDGPIFKIISVSNWQKQLNSLKV